MRAQSAINTSESGVSNSARIKYPSLVIRGLVESSIINKHVALSLRMRAFPSTEHNTIRLIWQVPSHFI